MNQFIILSSKGSQDLESISLGVAIAVIALLAITYIMLFYIWHRYYAKCIKNGLEDESMKRSIMEEYKKFLKPIPLKEIKQDTILEQNNIYNKTLDFKTVTDEVEFKKKRMSLSLNIVLGCLYLIMIGIFGLGIYTRVTTGMTNYFGESYLVIKTGSMESKNESNEYLFTNDLNNQIKQYSLIQLDEVNKDNMNVYDIYAFYDNEGNIIVHRLINITTENGVSKYTFRGDANTVSADYERSVDFKRIIGRYNGTNNFILGVCNLYLSSNIGLITVFFAFSAALFFDIFEAKANIAETERKRILLKQIFPLIVRNYKDEDLNINVHIDYKEGRKKNMQQDFIAMFMDKDGNCDVFENSLTQILKCDVHEYVDCKYTNYRVFKKLPGVDRNIIFDIDLIDRRGHDVEKALEEKNEKYKSSYKYETSLSGFDKKFTIYFEVIDNRIKK